MDNSKRETPENLSRREFLKKAGFAIAALISPAIACGGTANINVQEEPTTRKDNQQGEVEEVEGVEEDNFKNRWTNFFNEIEGCRIVYGEQQIDDDNAGIELKPGENSKTVYLTIIQGGKGVTIVREENSVAVTCPLSKLKKISSKIKNQGMRIEKISPGRYILTLP